MQRLTEILCYLREAQPFCSSQDFSWLGEAYAHEEQTTASLSLPFQTFISFRSALTETPRLMLEPSGPPTAQWSWHITAAYLGPHWHNGTSEPGKSKGRSCRDSGNISRKEGGTLRVTEMRWKRYWLPPSQLCQSIVPPSKPSALSELLWVGLSFWASHYPGLE